MMVWGESLLYPSHFQMWHWALPWCFPVPAVSELLAQRLQRGFHQNHFWVELPFLGKGKPPRKRLGFDQIKIDAASKTGCWWDESPPLLSLKYFPGKRLLFSFFFFFSLVLFLIRRHLMEKDFHLVVSCGNKKLQLNFFFIANQTGFNKK